MTEITPTPALPAGHRLRRPQAADAAAVARIRRAVDVSRHGDSDVTVEEVREEWALPRLSMDDDVWLVDDGGGATVAYGFCWMEGPPHDVVADQVVLPERRGLGLSEALLDLGQARAAEMARAAPDERVALGVWTHESDAARLDLFARHGFLRVRSFLRLERDLSQPLETTVWPPGVVVRGFRRDRDEAAVHAAGEEAFLDHFRPTAMSLEEWLEYRFARTDFDPGLWFVAWEGDEVAGGVLALKTPLGGYIDELFVRRPWRGRGLGRALLLHEFAELRRRGLQLAYLGVDADNPTGAMQLYLSAGLESKRGATHFLEKEIRAR